MSTEEVNVSGPQQPLCEMHVRVLNTPTGPQPECGAPWENPGLILAMMSDLLNAFVKYHRDKAQQQQVKVATAEQLDLMERLRQRFAPPNGR